MKFKHTRKTRIIQRLSFLITLGVFTFTLFSTQAVFVYAITQTQKDAIKSGARYYNTEEDGAIECEPSTNQPAVEGNVYLIGDSIGTQIEGPLGTELSGSGREFSANAVASRNLPMGIAAIDNDRATIESAGAVVVELGTNSAGFDAEAVQEMVNKIRGYNSSVRIFWIDTAAIRSATLAQALGRVNEVIYDQSGPSNYSIISWNQEVFGEDANPRAIDPFAGNEDYFRDNVHPSPAGVEAMTNLIVSSLTGSSNPSTETGNCACSGAGGGNLVGREIAEQIYNFFIGVGLQPWQAAGILGNMRAESGLEPQRLQGTPPGTITPAETFSGSLGWGLVQWTPGSKMIDTFTPPSQANELLNQLNFLWDQLEGRGTIPEQTAGNDIKATTDVENATVAFQGTPWPGGTVTYNGTNYGPYYGFERPADKQRTIAFRINSAKEYLAEFGNGSGGSGGPGITPACPGGSAPVNPNGYAYPVAPLRQNGDRPQNGHDQPYAYDFMRPGGTAVYAVYDGVIAAPSSGEYYKEVPGCYRINFHADDGYKYWYGHLQNIMVRDGERVSAGQQIAEVADDSLGPVCHGRAPSDQPASHLHLDRGYPAGTQGGGGDYPRNDPNFIPLMQRLYDDLPAGGGAAT